MDSNSVNGNDTRDHTSGVQGDAQAADARTAVDRFDVFDATGFDLGPRRRHRPTAPSGAP